MTDEGWLDPVLEKLHYVPVPDDEHVQVEDDSSFHHDVERLITDGLGVDPQEKRHSLETLRREFVPLLCDAVEQAETSEQSKKEAYEDKKAEFFRSVVNRDEHTYTIIFPFHLGNNELNDTVTVLGHELKPADHTELESGLESYTAHYSSKNSTETADRFREYDGEYWQLQIKARDSTFAYRRGITIFRYFYGILNHLLLRWKRPKWTTAGEPAQKPAPGLQLPAGVLVYSATAAETRNEPAQLTINRESISKHAGHSQILSEFKSLPQFPPLDSLTEAQERLYAAAISYQKGSGTANANDAFFAFWRGLEVLALSDQSSNEELVDRAQQILWSVSGPDLGNPENRRGNLWLEQSRLLDAMNSLDDLRNTMVHEGPDVEIQPIDVVAVKTLLDAYFDVYFEYWDMVGEQNFKKLLDGLVLSPDERSERVTELEEQIDILREANEFDTQRTHAGYEDDTWMLPVPDY